MFFIVSKLISFLFSPFTWILLLLVLSIFSTNILRKRKFLLASLLLILFFSNSFIFDECMRKWEEPIKQNYELDSVYDAAIVLSGMINYDVSHERLQFNRRNDRLMQAVLLYKKQKVKKLFFSGGSGSLVHRDTKEALMVKPFLQQLGIQDTDLVIETASDNTYQNALYSKPLLAEHFPKGKFLLITSAFHEPRALACFRKQGINVTPYSTDRYSGPRKFQLDHVLIPNVEALYNWDSLIHEWIGYVTYKMMGYL